ncbi:sugar-binding protein [Amycolatopsis lurida]
MRALLAGVLAAALAAGLASPVTAAGAEPRADLDVLFVGAHPDDEASTLSTIGQLGLEAGVVTVTRGEGGGNAVGPEEGPELGLLREAEERKAVGRAGITDVFNLDRADFYYTVSSPLTEQAWGHESTLEKLVRVVRQTRPEIVFTMDQAPSPGNHGNHQYAARLAFEAYTAAADPSLFPGAGKPWAVAKLFTTGLNGDSATGPDCVSAFTPDEPTDRVWGVWAGKPGPGGKTWAQIEREAQREYASQGWAGFPDAPTDPAKIGCDYFTQVASRVPYQPESRGVEGLLAGAVPMGATLTATADRYRVTPGEQVRVDVRSSKPGDIELTAPEGWLVQGRTVTVPADAQPGKARIRATLSTVEMTEAVVEVVPPVVATQEPLPQVAQYDAWARESGFPDRAGDVLPVLTVPSGGTRDITVTVRNESPVPRQGVVSLALPAGFGGGEERPYPELAPGATHQVKFGVHNTDASLPSGKDFPYQLVASDGSTTAALEIVPATVIPRAQAAPVVDGAAGEGEYPAEALDISARWEGDDCASAADCSGTARLSWHDDTLYALVDVTDDVAGTKLPTADCKRHWRTDAVELTFDPRGRSENTASTYKLAVLPSTSDGGPCAFRDADNAQGPAPGVEVAAQPREGGYAVEVAIPMERLPGAVDPASLGLNVLVYDSDTQDKTGQTRIGWSTWGGVQGDPYRWGRATVDGYTPPPDRPIEPPEPVLPLEVLASVDSPQTLEQSIRLGLPPGAAAASRPIHVRDGWLYSAESGTASVFAPDGRHVVEVAPGRTRLPGGPVLVGFTNTRGGTAAAKG